MKGDNKRLFMIAHYQLMQEWKADHPQADMDEAYQATRFEVYKKYRADLGDFLNRKCEEARELIDNLT